MAGVDPIDHDLDCGGREGRRPHPSFDGEWYVLRNPDVQKAGMNPLIRYSRYGGREGRRAHKSVVVYTAILGNYDELRSPLVVDPDLDYMAFVDDWITEVPAPWVRIPYSDDPRGPRLTAKFIKTHPHLLCPQYEVSVWIDGAFRIRDVRSDSVNALLDGQDMALFPHPERDCAYDEAEVVRQRGLDSPDAIDRMVGILKSRSYPRRAGLLAAGLMIRRHNEPHVVNAMEEWWRLISTGSVRDQLSLNFVIWQLGLSYKELPGVLWANELAEWTSHRSGR